MSEPELDKAYQTILRAGRPIVLWAEALTVDAQPSRWVMVYPLESDESEAGKLRALDLREDK